MSFPETRHTLIQRLAQGDEAADWRTFLDDYWGPLCRFAQRRGGLSAVDAEDVAAQALEAVVRGKLLERWTANRAAKLRTLLCTIVRNVISNRARISSGRERLAREHGERFERYQSADGEPPTPEQEDAFYAAWVESVVQAAVESLLEEDARDGNRVRFAILYGRICDGMSPRELAESLGLTSAAVNRGYRQARERLGQKLRDALRSHVMRYTHFEEMETDFIREWSRMGEYLTTHGGLESAVRESYRDFPPEHRNRWMVKVTLP